MAMNAEDLKRRLEVLEFESAELKDRLNLVQEQLHANAKHMVTIVGEFLDKVDELRKENADESDR